MASKKVRPTPPPGGPALVRPALGALLLGLSGMACGDDGTGDTASDSQPPMPNSEEGPMPAPTTDDATTSGSTTAVPPMIPPTTTGESADTGSSTDGGTEIPPMPNPTAGESTAGESESGSTTAIPPMPPPDGGGAPDDDQDL